MKNILLLATTTLLWALPSFSMSSAPVEPVGIVTVVDSEVEVEYIPNVTVEVVHSEVEINGVIEDK